MPKDYQGEQILVVTRALFDQLGAFQGTNTNVSHYLPTLLNPENNFFMDRGEAENDPTHKQLIPYCIFRVKDPSGTRYLHYTRGKAGGESRLHAAVSIGIGGHINPVDQREDHLGMDTYMAGTTTSPPTKTPSPTSPSAPSTTSAAPSTTASKHGPATASTPSSSSEPNHVTHGKKTAHPVSHSRPQWSGEDHLRR